MLGSVFRFQVFLSGNRNQDFKSFYAKLQDVYRRVYGRPKVHYETAEATSADTIAASFRHFLTGQHRRPALQTITGTIHDNATYVRDLEIQHFLTVVPWAELSTVVVAPPPMEAYDDQDKWLDAYRRDAQCSDVVDLMENCLYLFPTSSFSWCDGVVRGTRAGLYLQLKTRDLIKTMSDTHEDQQRSYFYDIFEEIAAILSPARSDFITMINDPEFEDHFLKNCEQELVKKWGLSRFERNMSLIGESC